jgi:putative chitinase
MIDWPTVQSRLGIAADGIAGPITYGALIAKVGGRTPLAGLGAAMALHAGDYSIDANADRMAGFLGQCCVESGGFRYLREIWGPTAAQKKYDTPGNPLGNRAGDGFAMRGAGLIEVTGRYWFDRIGHALGKDLVGHPETLSDPEIAVLISLEWWRMNGMNSVVDTRDTLAVSRAVNRGSPNSTRIPLALDERIAATNRAKEILA